MEYFIFFRTDESGDVIGDVGVRKVISLDRLLGIAPAPAIHPSPEILHALKELIRQAKSEEQV